MRNKIIYGIIAIAIVGFHIWLYFDRPIPAAESHRKEKEAIIDSLNGEIRSRDLRIARRGKEKDSLHGVIRNLEAKLVTIKKNKDEKINLAGTYTIGDQQRFFTERYGK